VQRTSEAPRPPGPNLASMEALLPRPALAAELPAREVNVQQHCCIQGSLLKRSKRAPAAATVSAKPSAAAMRSAGSCAAMELLENFITEEQAEAIKEVEVRECQFRKTVLKRAPKAGFYRTERVNYSWGQHNIEHNREVQFPQWMEDIAKKVEARFGEPVNHGIVVKYSDGQKHHAPWHHDKSEEMGRKSG